MIDLVSLIAWLTLEEACLDGIRVQEHLAFIVISNEFLFSKLILLLMTVNNLLERGCLQLLPSLLLLSVNLELVSRVVLCSVVKGHSLLVKMISHASLHQGIEYAGDEAYRHNVVEGPDLHRCPPSIIVSLL